MDELKAKRHRILQDLSAEVSGRRITDTVEVDGWEFKVRTLRPYEDDWVLINTPPSGGDPAKLMMLRMKPVVAASLVAIDGTAVEELFSLPEDMDALLKEQLLRDANALREWRLEQVLNFVREDMDDALVGPLWSGCMKLSERKRDAEGEVEKKSKRAGSSASKRSSSHARAS